MSVTDKVERTKPTSQCRGKLSPKKNKAKKTASPQKASPSPNRRGLYPENENSSLFAPNYDPLLGPFGMFLIVI
jgi:hypothetical protein